MDYQARVVEIATLLRGRAPKLFPCNIAPRSCKPYTSILGLCSTTRQRVDAKVFIEKAKDAIAEQRRKKHEAGQGGNNGKYVDDQTMNIVVVAETDLAARKFRVTGAKVGGVGSDGVTPLCVPGVPHQLSLCSVGRSRRRALHRFVACTASRGIRTANKCSIQETTSSTNYSRLHCLPVYFINSRSYRSTTSK